MAIRLKPVTDWRWVVLGGVAWGATLLIMPSASGQSEVIPDNTLGAEASVVREVDVLTQFIEGGATRGSNLFHSFLEFNVAEDNAVYFNPDAAIFSILSRVTGNNPSNIFGQLGVVGDANLFLMNPNGIVFGENASLDISGSFYATTAGEISIGNNVFSAIEPDRSELLEVTPETSFLNHIMAESGDITSKAPLETGQSLTLAARNLELNGQLTAEEDLILRSTEVTTIRDTIEDVFTAQSGGNLEIQGNQKIDILAINHPEHTPFVSGGDLTLVSDGIISADAHFASGGNFSTRTLSGSLANFGSLYDPVFTSGGDYTVGDYTGASLQIIAGNDITYGTVVINAIDPEIDPNNPVFLLTADGSITGTGDVWTTVSTGELIVDFQSQENISVQGIATQGGAITLKADSGNITTQSFLDSSSDTGNGGAITLTTGSGDITTQASLFSRPLSGDGGAITLTTGSGDITTQANLFSASSSGNGGAITLKTDSGNITTQDVLFSFSNSENGGSITLSTNSGDITTRDFLDSFSILGNGGAITLNTNTGNITTQERLFSFSFSGPGDGGAITLEADLGDIITQKSLNSSAALGNGGAITLSTNSGNITTQDFFTTSSDIGNGGNITLNAESGNILTEDFLSSVSNSGKSGTIRLTTGLGDISIQERLDSLSFLGTGGDIVLTTEIGNIIIQDRLDSSSDEGNSGTITLTTDSGNINTTVLDSSSNSGNGGETTLTTVSGDITTRGLLSSRSFSGNGGNIIITTMNSGDITTQGLVFSDSFSGSGNAGDITFSSNSGDILTQRQLDSSSNEGNSGAISITTNFGNITTQEGSLFALALDARSFSGNGGAITLTTDSGSIKTTALDSSSSLGSAGNIMLTTNLYQVGLNTHN